MTTIRVNAFSRKSVQSAIRQLEDYRKELRRKCKEFVNRLGAEGVEIAKAQVTSMDAVFNGDLLASIHTEENSFGDKYRCVVVADDKSALYVEFGTGTRGEAKPFDGELPKDFTPDPYNSGSTIFETKDGRVGWIYPADDGKFYFTEGMPSRPFMWNTSNELPKRVETIAKEIFGKK